LVPAIRTNPPSIKYNALKTQAVRGGIKKTSKENRNLYDMSFEYDDQSRTLEKRDSMWGCRYEERDGRENVEDNRM
jgi:hypothetical protein